MVLDGWQFLMSEVPLYTVPSELRLPPAEVLTVTGFDCLKGTSLVRDAHLPRIAIGP